LRPPKIAHHRSAHRRPSRRISPFVAAGRLCNSRLADWKRSSPAAKQVRCRKVARSLSLPAALPTRPGRNAPNHGSPPVSAPGRRDGTFDSGLLAPL
jgi:hypothetical protein